MALSYDKILATADQFDSTVRTFFVNDGSGLNVTAPFKRDAFEFVNELDPAAKAAGAVNTIRGIRDLTIGYNTDGIGLINDLKRLDWLLAARKVLVVGAGGAAQGIVGPLLESGANLTVANRTVSRAGELKANFAAISVAAFDELEGGWDLVINATTAGWLREGLQLPDVVFQNAHCYDLGYQRNGLTPFIQQVGTCALAVADGLGMLVAQAAEAFRIWHGIKPHTGPVLEALRRPKRQFIAGAVCPRCQKRDTIYVERDLRGLAVLRACHACDFSEDVAGNVSVNLR